MKTKDQEVIDVGVIGAGGMMGGIVARNLLDGGACTVLYDTDREKCAGFRAGLDARLQSRARIADSTSDLFAKLRRSDGDEAQSNAVIWMMIPGGKITNDFVGHLCTLVEKGDIIIDAANTTDTASIANHNALAGRGAFYLDVGFGGGPNAARNQNAVLMVGGNETAYEKVEDVFRMVAGEGNYGFVGGPGAGQAAKGVTNTKFYADLVLIAEMYSSIQAVGEEGRIDIRLNEMYRLASRIPHITYEAMEAGADALINGEIPKDAPAPKISDQVKAMVERMKKLGVSLPAIEAVLDVYPDLPRDERGLYSAIKRRITGH